MGNDRRVIDMNELVKKRIDALALKMQRPENSGFVEGINADTAGVDELVEGMTAPPDFDPDLLTEEPGDPDTIISSARAEAARIIEEARKEAEQTEKAARDESVRMFDEAKAKGYREGFKEGTVKAEAEYKSKMDALDEEKDRLEDLYQKRFNDIEPELVDRITDVYEHVLKTDLKIHKTIAGHLVADALRNIEGSRSFLIHISKDNYDYVNSRKNQLEEAVKTPGSVIEIMEDISLPPDSCMIETDGGIFDCSLGTELSELSTRLKMLSYSGKEE